MGILHNLSAFHFFIYKAGIIEKKKKKLPIFKVAVGTKGNNAYNIHSVKQAALIKYKHIYIKYKL